jgi:hypothetical protein
MYSNSATKIQKILFRQNKFNNSGGMCKNICTFRQKEEQ